MGMFVDYIENECERLLQESPQFTELQREDHALLDEYPFLNMITDSNGVTKVLDLNYAETEALTKFCLVEEDINCWKRLQMYLLGIAHAMGIIELFAFPVTLMPPERMITCVLTNSQDCQIIKIISWKL